MGQFRHFHCWMMMQLEKLTVVVVVLHLVVEQFVCLWLAVEALVVAELAGVFVKRPLVIAVGLVEEDVELPVKLPNQAEVVREIAVEVVV
jgi:hypothetical protein